jgi:hypothetical protein
MQFLNTTFRRFALIAVATLVCWSSSAEAQRLKKVQGPARGKVTKAQISAAKASRRQTVNRATVKEGITLAKTVAGRKSLSTPQVRKQITSAPLATRLTLFKTLAEGKGNGVQTFARTIKGRLKNGKTNKVIESKTTFFEVLPATKTLFRETMGENVIWFASSSSPYHLHTLLADQNGGKNLTHNTYGTNLDKASINRTQYLAPAVLDKAQMARFTKYLNAGIANGDNKGSVYGFKTSKGKVVYETACTNWATTAPIGNVHPWIAKLDTAIAADASLGPKFKDGLHAALATPKSAKGRATLVDTVLASGQSQKVKTAAKRLLEEFNTTLKQHPNRPADLVARQSLSKVMGVSRSQDPAKWMFDLILSRSTPVVGVISTAKNANFKAMEFDLGIMGTIKQDGVTVRGNGRGLGAVEQAN